jgi:hypothetical protein
MDAPNTLAPDRVCLKIKIQDVWQLQQQLHRVDNHRREKLAALG